MRGAAASDHISVSFDEAEVIVTQERQHSTTQFFVGSAGSPDVVVAVGGLQRECGVKDLLEESPTRLFIHRYRSLNSLFSHARAMRQSRSSVSRDAKRLGRFFDAEPTEAKLDRFRLSWVAVRQRIQRIIEPKQIPGDNGEGMEILVELNPVCPPPRFRDPRARAKSTRTRRMIWAQIAMK